MRGAVGFPMLHCRAYREERLLCYDDRKRRRDGVSSGSPDYFRQDKKEEETRQKREAGKKENLALLKLKMETQAAQKQDAAKTKPEQERKIEVASADEKTSTANPKEFTERQRRRQEELDQAKEQGGPEAQPAAPA